MKDSILRVLFIVHRFLPRFAGGTEIYTYQIADGLRRAGHVISVLAAEVIDSGDNYDGLYKDEPYDNIPIRRLCFNWRRAVDPHGALYLFNPAVERVIKEYVGEFNPDVVHITSCVHLSASVIDAVYQSGVPLVLTLTDFWFICPNTLLLRPDLSLCDGWQDGLTCQRCLYGKTRTYRGLMALPAGLRKWILRSTRNRPFLSRRSGSLNLIHAVDRRNEMLGKILNKVDHIISPSRFLRDIFIDGGMVEPKRLFYLPHGHRVDLAQAGREKTPSDRIRFGFTGNMLRHKGVDILVAAFGKLGSHDSACLNLYGDPDAQPQFGQHLRNLAADNPAIRFCGGFRHEDIGAVLANTDVVVVPSVCYENAPLTIAEAFAAQTPVIATDLGAMAEAIQYSVDGLLFRRGDADDLARQMYRMIEEPGLLDHLRRGINPVKTVEQEVLELESLYRDMSGR